MVLFIYILILFFYLATPGLGCGVWSSLQHAGHLVESGELLVAACGIQFPNQELNLCGKHRVLANEPPGKSSEWHFRKSLMAADCEWNGGPGLEAGRLLGSCLRFQVAGGTWDRVVTMGQRDLVLPQSCRSGENATSSV